MNITPTEAADALRDIDATAQRSREFKSYRIAAPYFFLWGAIWIIGYGATGLSPRYGVVWLPLTVVGMAASAYIGWRSRTQVGRGRSAAAKAYGQRMWMMFIAFAVFIAATYAILPPHDVNQMNAFPALLTGMTYAIAGIWSSRRYLWLGAAIIAATMLGFVYLAPWFAFWMAAVGGGGLILTGFWMRNA
ncbi:MAG: hypothetical protein K1X51_02865 [Rhodospirillaceae bacterium]|nr:hypothetical protein [Rhodospirillaceae bacterium]